jgi:opacity protein-like surface antigen
MKKIPVIVLVALGLAVAGMAEAANPKKRTRNQNRIGPYVTGLVGMSSYGGDQSGDEQALVDLIADLELPFENESVSTDDSDIGYQASFGYRFSRYLAGELGLSQFGSLTTSLHVDIDIDGDNQGPVPANLEYSFSVGGPVISVLGILPIGGDKFELFGRVGYLFASVEREFSSRVNGQRGLSQSAKGDSQNLVYGAGANWNINAMYSVRAEYQVLDDVGEERRTGTEDLNSIFIGAVVRF